VTGGLLDQVSLKSIRSRILKVDDPYPMHSHQPCFTQVDPFEDTESVLQTTVWLAARDVSLKSIRSRILKARDDDESTLDFTLVSLKSIRSRILKVIICPNHIRGCTGGFTQVDPFEDTERYNLRCHRAHVRHVSLKSIRSRILKARGPRCRHSAPRVSLKSIRSRILKGNQQNDENDKNLVSLKSIRSRILKGLLAKDPRS